MVSGDLIVAHQTIKMIYMRTGEMALMVTIRRVVLLNP